MHHYSILPNLFMEKPTGTIKVQIGSTDSILIEYDRVLGASNRRDQK